MIDLGARQTTKCFKMQSQHERQIYIKENKNKSHKYTRNLA